MAKKYTDEEQALRDSLTGSSYDKQYFTTDQLQSAANIVKDAESGKTDWKSAHDYVEGIRSGYGYSGGNDGSQYIQIPQAMDYSAYQYTAPKVTQREKYSPGYVQNYEALPSYVSQNQEAIDNALNAILNREAFNYDYTTDPRWQSYKKEYTREGQRATADALGQYAAATGGMPSTAAMTAATQAGDYYSAQMTDKIPELYALAYSMYQDEGNQLRNNLAALVDKENMEYGRYLDDLAQYNRNRDFDYGAWLNDRDYGYQLDRDAINDSRYENEWNYQLGRDALTDRRYDDELNYQKERDALGDSRYDTEWNYQVSQNEKDDAFERAKILAQYGDFSGFEDIGYTPEQIANMESAYNADKKTAKGSSGGRGSSGGNKLSFDSENERDQALYDEAIQHSVPEDWISEHYKEYGYATASGAKKAFSNMSGNNFTPEGLPDRDYKLALSGLTEYLSNGQPEQAEYLMDSLKYKANDEQWDSFINLLSKHGLKWG